MPSEPRLLGNLLRDPAIAAAGIRVARHRKKTARFLFLSFAEHHDDEPW